MSYGTNSPPSNPFEVREEQQPLMGGSNQAPQIQTPFVEQGQTNFGDRPKNFPPCKPIVHHNINGDIPEHKRTFIRRAYFGWYIHLFCLFYNAICMTAALIEGQTLTGFFIALAAFILGTFVSFFVYWCLYTAVRKSSGSYYVFWFILFVLQIAIEVLYAVGIESTGGAGFLLMIKAFSSNVALGVMYALCCGFFIGITFYNLNVLNNGRKDYRSLGGNEMAAKELRQDAFNVAYDNRETIKQFAKDNKETIKQVVVENKDTIIQFAKDNKEDIARVAVDNKDTIWENRDVIASVFEAPKK